MLAGIQCLQNIRMCGFDAAHDLYDAGAFLILQNRFIVILHDRQCLFFSFSNKNVRYFQLRSILCIPLPENFIDTSAYGSKAKYCDFHIYPSSD